MGSLIQNTIFGKSKNSFVSTWRTSNTSTGSSNATQIKLPLIASGTYNFTVDWGDGTSNSITSCNQAQTIHTYTVAADYTIKINGTCFGWLFNNNGDRLKFLSIERWGTNFRLGTDQGGYFYGCANLKLDSVLDVLNLVGTTSLASAFRFCNAMTTINRSNEWNTSSITDISYISQQSPLFNPLISSWNVENVTTMQGAFFASGFNNDISNWNTSKNTNLYLTFADNANFNQNIGDWDTGNVVNMKQTFQSARAFNQNIGAWNLSSVTNLANMFLGATAFNNGGSSDINNWNTFNVSTMNSMFYNAKSFNQNIGNWNVSNVTSFNSMFCGAETFNNGGSSDINNWNLKTTEAIDLSNMFQGEGGGFPIVFNQPIGNWNTIAVTNMSGMFQKTGNGFHFFNQPIGNWNTSNVTNMSNMFRQGGTDGGAFNQNLGKWNVSKVLNFSGMFLGARQFNNGGSPDINNWTLSTTGDINMSQMFSNINANNLTTFNQPLGNWNTAAVNNMSQMFGATAGSVAFNQNIGNWNVSNVVDFTNFMVNKSSSNFSSTNLDAIYNGWSTRPVKTPINITFGTAKRTSASDAGKSILTSAPNNWIITDGGI